MGELHCAETAIQWPELIIQLLINLRLRQVIRPLRGANEYARALPVSHGVCFSDSRFQTCVATIEFIELDTYKRPCDLQLPSPLFSQTLRMRTPYTSQTSLNIFWFQIFFELFVARLHFRLPDFDLTQLQTQTSGDFLRAGLR